MKQALAVVVLGAAFLGAGCNFGNSTSPADGGGIGFETGPGGASLTAGGGSGASSSQDFGSVQVGQQSAPASIVVTNGGDSTSGPVAVTLTGGDASSFGIDSDGCHDQPLGPGQTCSVSVHFLPTSAGSKSAALSVDATPGGLATVALAGNATVAGALSITPATQAFGTVAAGASSQATTFTVKSVAATAGNVTMSLTGSDSADFAIAKDGCSTKPLAAGATCTLDVTFSPSKPGSKTASLQASAGTLTATSTLSGTAGGTAAFSVTPATYDFGSLSDGLVSTAETFTVKNTGGVASGAPVVAVSGPNQGDFVVASNGCGGPLAPGATCTFGVTFKPATTAGETASVGISAPSTTAATATVSGTGLAPAPIAFDPTTQDFGTEVPGQTSSDLSFTLTNSAAIASGPVAVTLTGTDASQFVLSTGTCVVNGAGATLAPAGTCSVTVHFKPDGSVPAGPAQATLQATATPGGTTAAALTGTITTPTALTVAPTSQGFGTVVQTQASSDFPFVVTNTGGVTSASLTVALGGTNGGQFALGTDGCSKQTLAAGATCTVNVHFAPGAGITGVQNASVSIGDSATDTATATLTGTAALAASLGITAPTGFTGFGPTANPTVTPDVAFRVTNSGGVTTGKLQVTLGGTNGGQFGLGQDTCSNQTLVAGGTCLVNVHFAPTSGTVGNEQATLTVTGMPGGSAPLSFVGIAAAPATFVVQPPTGFQGFGAVSLTKSATASFTVKNSGGVPSGIPTVTSASKDFVVSAGTPACTAALAAGATCGFVLTFTPSAPPAAESSVLTAAGPSTVSGTYTATGSGGIPTLVIAGPTNPYTGFGTVAVGQSASAAFTLKNTGPVATLAAPTITSSSGDYVVSAAATTPCTGVLAAGGTCNFVVTFKPSAPNASDAATLTASVTPGNSGTFSLTSNAAEATLAVSAPTGWTGFGTVEVGTSATATFTVTNTGPVATNTAPSVTSSNPDFAVSAGPKPCTSALAANGTCNVVLTFTPPKTVTNDASTLTASATQAASGTYQVSGSGAVPTLQVVPPTSGFAFGFVTVGQTASATFQVTNTGPVASGVPSVTSSNADFTVTAGATNPCVAGLAVNGSCNFTVTFKPSAMQTESTVLTAASAPANAGTYTLSGQGAVGGLGKIAPWSAGPVVQGKTASTTYTITNSGHGATDPLVITGPTAGGVFALQNDGCSGKEVPPNGGTCTFGVVFQPTTANTTPGTSVNLALSISDPSSVSDVTGTTLSGMPLSPSFYLVFSSPNSFGTVTSGTTGGPPSITVSVTNYGGVAAPAFDDTPFFVASTTPTGAQFDFDAVNVNCPVGGATSPGLGVLASCTLTVTFAPPVPPLGAFTGVVDVRRYDRTVLPFTGTFSGTNN